MINEKNNVKTQLVNIFKERRNFAQNVCDNNFKLALQNEMFNKSFHNIRAIQFDLGKTKTNSLEEKTLLEKLKIEKQNLLKGLNECGLTKKDLLPQYHCEKCKDTGFIKGKKCNCYKLEQNKLFLKACGINKTNLPKFENIDYSIFGDSKLEIEKIYKLAQSFINKFYETTKQNIVIVGNTGVGKTYLTECLLNEAINNDIYSIYTTAFNLNQDFLNYHLADVANKKYILDPYLSCDLLIIDDLGSEKILNNVTIENLYIVLNERARKNLKTIVTTNLLPDAVQDKYEDRVFSRLFNKQISIILNMPGEDLRFKKQA